MWTCKSLAILGDKECVEGSVNWLIYFCKCIQRNFTAFHIHFVGILLHLKIALAGFLSG